MLNEIDLLGYLDYLSHRVFKGHALYIPADATNLYQKSFNKLTDSRQFTLKNNDVVFFFKNNKVAPLISFCFQYPKGSYRRFDLKKDFPEFVKLIKSIEIFPDTEKLSVPLPDQPLTASCFFKLTELLSADLVRQNLFEKNVFDAHKKRVLTYTGFKLNDLRQKYFADIDLDSNLPLKNDLWHQIDAFMPPQQYYLKPLSIVMQDPAGSDPSTLVEIDVNPCSVLLAKITCAYFIFPIEQINQIPDEIKDKTVISNIGNDSAFDKARQKGFRFFQGSLFTI